MNRWRQQYGLGAKFKTPWTMRLEREFADLQKLKSQSSILEFRYQNDPPDRYQFRFNGKSLVPGKGEAGVKIGDHQEVEISLGTDFPRRKPEVHWLTPILHPNISGGSVCFGNFVANWSPLVSLSDLLEILWDYSRLAILNPLSGYGGPAGATWQQLDRKYAFPVDKRPLRDKVLPNDVGSSPLRPAGGPDDVVILRDDESGCQFLE